MSKQEVILVGCLFLLAVVVRLAWLDKLSYWSGDEEFIGIIVHRIVHLRKPILISPSATLGFNLGPLFHYLTAIFYWLLGETYKRLFVLAAIIGGVTTVTIYLVAREAGARRMGFLAALIYATSFTAALADRRWWVHSLDSLFNILAVFSILRILKQDFRFVIVLALLATFGWNADPSYLSISLFILLAWVAFRLPRWRKDYLPAVALIAVSLLPLIVFEFRHQFVSLTRIQRFFSLGSRGSAVGPPRLSSPFAIRLLDGVGSFFWVPPTAAAEGFWCYCEQYLQPGWWLGLMGMGIVACLIFSLQLLLRGRNLWFKRLVFLLLLQLVPITLGLFLYERVFGGNVFPFYLLGSFPALALLLATALNQLSSGKAAIIVGTLVLGNLATGARSSLLIPFSQREQVISYIRDRVGTTPFRLEARGDGYIEGGGWKYLLLESGAPPQESYIDPVVGWLLPPAEQREPQLVVEISNASRLPDFTGIGDETTIGYFSVATRSRDTHELD